MGNVGGRRAAKAEQGGEAWVMAMKQRLLGVEKQADWLTAEELARLCAAVRGVLAAQPSLVELPGPVTIVGDLFGQFHDLRRLFQRNGEPEPANPYLFLGNYVDRGRHGTETIALLFCYKILYPDHVWLLRGNHESAYLSKVYGFHAEMAERFSRELWQCFSETFDWLPVAGLVGGRIFAVHGGLSPDLHSWDDIRAIKRPQGMPTSGLMCDLLWSDPCPDLPDGWGQSVRKISFAFSEEAVYEFCDKLGVSLIVRSHQRMDEGFEFFAGGRLVTVFSAPSYCGVLQNDAAVLKVSAELTCSFLVFSPTFLPGARPKPPPRVPRRYRPLSPQ